METKDTVIKELPYLRLALSPDGMQSLLQERVFQKDNHFLVEDCQVNYLHYKPQPSCIVGYTVRLKDRNQNSPFNQFFYAKLYNDSEFNLAQQKMQKRRYADPLGYAPVNFFPDLKMILFSFPNDRSLRFLKWLLDPQKLKRIVLPYFPQYTQSWRVQDHKTEIEIVRYKPERRCLLRCKMKFKQSGSESEAKEKFFLRIYSDQSGKQVQNLFEKFNSLSLNKAQKVNIPSVLGYNENLRLLIISKVKGIPLLELIGHLGFKKALEQTANSLAYLHTLPIQVDKRWDVTEEIRDLKKQALIMTSVLPDLPGKINALIFDLQKKSTSIEFPFSNFLHGDFYEGQVLVDKDKVYFLDFDESINADPLLDVANFIAHLQYQTVIASQYDWMNYIELFKQSYFKACPKFFNSKRLSWYQAYSLLRLAIWPFPALKPNWQFTTEKILDLAEKELGRVDQ